MIALIVAYSKNRVIGNNGVMPWKIKGELHRFKELTINNVVIMGRKTFEAIGNPLENRVNIIVTSTIKINKHNCLTASSLQEALNLVKNKDIFIIGGERLYKEAIPIVDKMYITEIDKEFDGDTFFPEFNENDFVKELNEEFKGANSYKYLTYTRK